MNRSNRDSEAIQHSKGIDSAVISDDRRLRTVAEGLGVRVTGTIGVVVRAVAEGRLTEGEAKDLVRRLDSRGHHTTGELREKADELIEDVARENGDENRATLRTQTLAIPRERRRTHGARPTSPHSTVSVYSPTG